MTALSTGVRGATLAVLAGSLAGCGQVPVEGGAGVGAIAQAVGEPQSGFPSMDERLGLMAINRARSDPQAWKGPSSTSYPAVAPVAWSYDLSRSSRFHAINLKSTGVTLMHTSPCPLDPNVGKNGCDGSVGCACQSPVPNTCTSCKNVAAENNCGTAPFTRIGYFSSIATGEVVAAGYADTWASVDGWITEPAGADGHRRNLTDQGITSNTMGFGHTDGAGCFSSFDVSDSGFEHGLAMATIPTASPRPARPAAGTVRFYATWAEAGGTPASLSLVVDGKCTAMTRELGDPKLNSTWIADVQLGAGCHAWWVLGRTAAGQRVTYPTTGALQSSVGGAACAADWVNPAPAASCEGAAPMPDLVMDASSHAGADLSMPAPDLAPPGGDTGRAVGESCAQNGECASGVCAVVGSAGYCTARCDPGASPCPAGLTCGVIDGQSYCVQPSAAKSGGCSTAPGQPSGGAAPLSVLGLCLLLSLLRHRRATLALTLGLWAAGCGTGPNAPAPDLSATVDAASPLDGSDADGGAPDLAAPRDLAAPPDLTPPADLLRPCDADPACGDGGACCGGFCTAPSEDPANCGFCGKHCQNGWNCCAGACSNPSIDPSNCGYCGHTCPGGDGGVCQLKMCAGGCCDPGWADCLNPGSCDCETHTDVNPNNCGACGHVCAAPNGLARCLGGKCLIGGCDAGFFDCNHLPGDGCEVDGNTDAQNCGACGHACTPGQKCVGGKCG